MAFEKWKKSLQKQWDKEPQLSQHERIQMLEEQKRQVYEKHMRQQMVAPVPGTAVPSALGSQQMAYQQWQKLRPDNEVELCGIKFTERELHVMKQLLERIARQKQMESLPADIDQAVKEAVQMLG